MQCPQCQHENRPQAKFCEECAAPVTGASPTIQSYAKLKTEVQGLSRALTDALEYQTATAEILRTISGSPTDVQPVFDLMVRTAVKLCDAIFSTVAEVDGDVIRLRASYGFAPARAAALHAIFDPEAPSAVTIREGKTLHIPDAEGSPFRPFLQNRGYRSFLAVPVLKGDRAIAGSAWAGPSQAHSRQSRSNCSRHSPPKPSSRSRTCGFSTMTSTTTIKRHAVVAGYDFDGIRTLVDVGGGHGSILATVLAAQPDMRGVLFDLPRIVTGAGEHFQSTGVADRWEPVGGSFFEAVPAGGDAYMLATVIHDWDDEAATAILKTCHRAMVPGVKLLLLEQVIPPGNDPHPGKFDDLNMLVLHAGRERTAVEFRPARIGGVSVDADSADALAVEYRRGHSCLTVESRRKRRPRGRERRREPRAVSHTSAQRGGPAVAKSRRCASGLPIRPHGWA